MSVERTILFSETTLKSLENLVPESGRSNFVDTAVIDALEQVGKEKALDALENMEKFDVSGDDIVETVIKIRQEEAARLNLNQ